MANQNKILLKQNSLKKLKQILAYPIFSFKINYSKLNPKNYNWEKIKFALKMLIIIATAVFMVLLTIDLIKTDFFADDENEQFASDISDNIISYLDENYFTPDDAPDDASTDACNVMGIELHGDLITYIAPESIDENGNIVNDERASEDIVIAINEAEADESVKAIILEIDSYGGYPVAAEEIAQAIKKAKKPTIALVRGAATSAAYWAATGANIIFASALSDIGGIGVTFSYVDNYKRNMKDGLTYNSLSAGKFKDYGDPDKPLTNEEREMIMRDLNIVHENFIQAVAANRNLDIGEVRALANGSSMPGQMALENGLIDRIGGMDEVKDYLKEKIGEDTEVCW